MILDKLFFDITLGAVVGWICNYLRTKSGYFFLEDHVIKFQKNYFPVMGLGYLVKKRPLGRKIRLLVKSLKCSHIIYHSIAKLMLIKKNCSLRVKKWRWKKLQVLEHTLLFECKQWNVIYSNVSNGMCCCILNHSNNLIFQLPFYCSLVYET